MSKDKPLIAIVDDDTSVCRAVKRLVRSAGMEADTFTSGQEFVESLDGRPAPEVDCLVLDVQMPQMNGLEVQRRLETREHHIPIIFITAHDDDDIRTRALAAGAVAFLRKPFNDDLFIRTVQEALKRHAAQSP
ncbi:MAG TPA: response regulator [Candidatus Limnocylindria bacterium]|nr:response regulator [Candidatus Limnocylindria bacterium]